MLDRIRWADEMQPANRAVERLNPGLGDYAFERAAKMLADGARPRSVAFILNAPIERVRQLAYSLHRKERP
jgi:hypothetical protein